jgi:hypothetical protein
MDRSASAKIGRFEAARTLASFLHKLDRKLEICSAELVDFVDDPPLLRPLHRSGPQSIILPKTKS